MSRFNLWIEVEELSDDGEEVYNSGELGYLPDCLGEFETLPEAIAKWREILVEHYPAYLASSDVREEVQPEIMGIVCDECGQTVKFDRKEEMTLYGPTHLQTCHLWNKSQQWK